MSELTNGRPEISEHDKAVLNRIFNPGLPYADNLDEEDSAPVTEDVGRSPEVVQAKELELQGVKAAESGDLSAALDFFTSAVNAAPGWASAYNNRAQALRLKGDVQGAQADLDKAIELSEGKGKVACQAYTQRGLIKRLDGHDNEALNDFKAAARLGSEFAKQQIVAMNPYAALCNQMLGEVIRKLQTGEQ